MAVDTGTLETIQQGLEVALQSPGELGNMGAGALADVTGWNDRYSPDLPQALIDEWAESAAANRASEGMKGHPKPGGQASGLEAAWGNLRNGIAKAETDACQASDSKEADYRAIGKAKATKIANAIQIYVFNAKLNGPVQSMGTGFSFGSPFFHMVIIPFGDSELTPLCWLS